MGAYDNLIIISSFVIGIIGFGIGIHYMLKSYYHNTSQSQVNLSLIDEFKDL